MTLHGVRLHGARLDGFVAARCRKLKPRSRSPACAALTHACDVVCRFHALLGMLLCPCRRQHPHCTPRCLAASDAKVAAAISGVDAAAVDANLHPRLLFKGPLIPPRTLSTCVRVVISCLGFLGPLSTSLRSL